MNLKLLANKAMANKALAFRQGQRKHVGSALAR
jgi:hypothetical protein